jgi:predicted transglutaminase-like cysteine proteinase
MTKRRSVRRYGTCGTVGFVTHAVKTWARLATDAIEANGPTPAPVPTPAPYGKAMWCGRMAKQCSIKARQGHCVGFGGAQWGNTLPVDDHFVERRRARDLLRLQSR